MRVIKSSERHEAKVSLILLDWNVRESFHFLKYLEKQTISRLRFEVILIEYYDVISVAAKKHEDQIDHWILMEMPQSLYYHKHLMYNAGIISSNGEICVICDSDAMATPTFIQTIIDEFEKNDNIVLHLDQFRNSRKDLYPFNYPSFEEVLGPGCINNIEGKTAGIANQSDPLHNRNYGACMCARKTDLIKIGGADEHIDYLGHICGPYDMTFRLVNTGCKEIWHEQEFTMHTWHPGAAGVDNYLGPHDGRHVSTTALASLTIGRVEPFSINPAISAMQRKIDFDNDQLLEKLINQSCLTYWKEDNLIKNAKNQHLIEKNGESISSYMGFRIMWKDDKAVGFICARHREVQAEKIGERKLISTDFKNIRKIIDKNLGSKVRTIILTTRILVYMANLNTYSIQYANAYLRYVLSHKVKTQIDKSDTANLKTHSSSPKTSNLSIASAFTEKVKNKLQQNTARLKQFQHETRYLADNVERLVLFLTKKRSTLEEAGETVVYVDRKSIKIWIATLSKIGIISKSDVRLVQSVDQAKLEFLENKDQDGWGYTLVSSLLYSRFYSSILDYRIESRQKFFIV